MKLFIRVMKALSDPNRVKILKMLAGKELCVCEITTILGLAQSTVSKHLKTLEDAELIDSQRDGAWVNYRPTTGGKNIYANGMQKQLSGWLNDDKQIKKIVAQISAVDRQQIYPRKSNERSGQ